MQLEDRRGVRTTLHQHEHLQPRVRCCAQGLTMTASFAALANFSSLLVRSALVPHAPFGRGILRFVVCCPRMQCLWISYTETKGRPLSMHSPRAVGGRPFAYDCALAAPSYSLMRQRNASRIFSPSSSSSDGMEPVAPIVTVINRAVTSRASASNSAASKK